jgi:hypothetical protein
VPGTPNEARNDWYRMQKNLQQKNVENTQTAFLLLIEKEVHITALLYQFFSLMSLNFKPVCDTLMLEARG